MARRFVVVVDVLVAEVAVPEVFVVIRVRV
jgi:hypothetical protein